MDGSGTGEEVVEEISGETRVRGGGWWSQHYRQGEPWFRKGDLNGSCNIMHKVRKAAQRKSSYQISGKLTKIESSGSLHVVIFCHGC